MINALISLFAIFIVLVLTEIYWQKHKQSSELSRKAIHASVAIFIAFWPLYMSFHYIELISLAFFIMLLLSRSLNRLKRFFNKKRSLTFIVMLLLSRKSIYSVKRYSVGDLLFPITIYLLAVLEPSKVVFSIGILFMGVADSLAAVMGQSYGKSSQYKVFGQVKSAMGTIAFYLSALAILVIARDLDPSTIPNLNVAVIFLLPLVAAIAENISPFGLDNITVPMMVLIFLRWL
jgi:phytol kinase